MDENETETVPLKGTHLVDQLIAEQDDVIRQLDDLDAKILQAIIGLTLGRETTDKSAA